MHKTLRYSASNDIEVQIKIIIDTTGQVVYAH